MPDASAWGGSRNLRLKSGRGTKQSNFAVPYSVSISIDIPERSRGPFKAIHLALEGMPGDGSCLTAAQRAEKSQCGEESWKRAQHEL